MFGFLGLCVVMLLEFVWSISFGVGDGANGIKVSVAETVGKEVWHVTRGWD